MISSQSGVKGKWDRLLDGFRWLARRGRVLSVPFVLLIYCYLGFRLVQDWDTLGPTIRQAQVGHLVVSSILLFVALGITAGRWYVTLHQLGVQIGWWESLRIWFLSQAGRYVPGSIWPYVGRMYWGAESVPAGKMLSSLALELCFRVSSETGLAALLLPIGAWLIGADNRWMASAAAFSVVVILGHFAVIIAGPRIYRRLTPVIIGKIPGWEALGSLEVSSRSVGVQWLYYAASVGAVGIAFYFLVIAFHPLQIGALPALTGSLAAATVIGFLTPLAPNGWGVREGILVLLLSQLMPTSVAVMISVVSRVWLALVEGVWVILLVALGRLFRTSVPSIPGNEVVDHIAYTRRESEE